MNSGRIAAFGQCFLVLTVIYSCIDRLDAEQSLYFSLMVSSAAGMNTSSVVPFVERTLKEINSDPTLLPGCSLHYTRVLNTKCNGTKALQLFSEELNSDKMVLAVVGCGCSSVTELVARNSSLLPIISYASTSVVLGNRSVYHTLFRTNPSDEQLPGPLSTTLKYYDWKRLTIVSGSENQFTMLQYKIQNELRNVNVSVVNASTSSVDHISPLFKLIPHIYFLNTRPENTLELLCQGAKMGHFYPNYLWIVPGWYSENWWMEFQDYLVQLNCTMMQVEQALNRSLTLLPIPGSLITTTGDVNTTLLNPASYAATAVRALALAVNKSSCNITKQQLRMNLASVLFPGLSRAVSFAEMEQRMDSALLLQYREIDGAIKPVPVAIANNLFTYIGEESNISTWPDGIPPDGKEIRRIDLPPALLALDATLVAIGIPLIIVCLIFNIVFRNRKIVRMTSPNLNYLMLLGAATEMSSILFSDVLADVTKAYYLFCPLRRLLISIGHDICFSVALVKAGRIFFIFHKPSPDKKAVSDWKLVLIAAVIVGFDVIMNISLLIPNEIFGKRSFLKREDSPSKLDDKGILVVFHYATCPTTIYFTIFVVLTTAYKLTMHIVAMVFAVASRKIKVTVLNDYKYTSAIIYISTVLIIALLVVIFVSRLLLSLVAVVSLLIFSESMVFVTLTFFPKMINLYKDPKGEHVFSQRARTKSSCSEKNHTMSTMRSKFSMSPQPPRKDTKIDTISKPSTTNGSSTSNKT